MTGVRIGEATNPGPQQAHEGGSQEPIHPVQKEDPFQEVYLQRANDFPFPFSMSAAIMYMDAPQNVEEVDICLNFLREITKNTPTVDTSERYAETYPPDVSARTWALATKSLRDHERLS